MSEHRAQNTQVRAGSAPHAVLVLHAWYFVALPVQLAPPLAGAGFVHVRVLLWTPAPQVAPGTHAPHADQSDQLPAAQAHAK